jgi:hypothetical protein
MGEFRMALANHFEDQARWRDMKYAEYPDDHRNGLSAAALQLLAEVVREDYSDDDPVIQQLAELVGPDDWVSFGSAQARYDISRFGFDHPVGRRECGVLLQHLVRAEREELERDEIGLVG